MLEADTTYRARQLATGGATPPVRRHPPQPALARGRLDRYRDGRRPHRRGGRPWPAAHAVDLRLQARATARPRRAALARLPEPRHRDPVEPPPHPDPTALVDLLGRTRALLLQMLEEPLPTVEIARRLKVTPSAVSQHLQVLHATGLLTRARDRRHVLYRRSPIGDRSSSDHLATAPSPGNNAPQFFRDPSR